MKYTVEVVIDRARRKGKGYVDKNSKKLCKSIKVRFSTFIRRAKFYWSRSNVKIKLDLTKSLVPFSQKPLWLI